MTQTPPPQQPYGQQQPPGYYQGPPPKQKHTLRNVLLIVIALGVLFIGGCLAVVGVAANEVGNEIDKSLADDEQPGGPKNPMDIEPGEAFSVRDFDYAAGWTLGADGLGDAVVKKFKVTNNREDRDSALVEIKLWRGTEVVALIDCTTEPIQPGTTVTLGCFSGDDLPKKYDRVTINDAF